MKRFIQVTRLHYTQALSVELTYRFALLQGLFGVAIGSIGLLLFWLAAGRAGGSSGADAGQIATYTPSLLAAYFLAAGVLTTTQENHLAMNLSAGIRMGKLSAALLRPYPFLASVLAQVAAQATLRLMFTVPLVAILVLGVEPLRQALTASDPARFGILALAVGLGLIMCWLVNLAVGMLAFDMTQTWGPELIFMSMHAVASGVSYPSDLLPPVWAAAVAWTPLYYMIGFPALIFTGRLTAVAAWSGLGQGLLVATVMALVVGLMWRRGMRKFEAIGI